MPPCPARDPPTPPPTPYQTYLACPTHNWLDLPNIVGIDLLDHVANRQKFVRNGEIIPRGLLRARAIDSFLTQTCII